MLEEKDLFIANFNCTFGKSSLPMLEHFETIVYPALTQDYTRREGDNKYRFMNVKLFFTQDEFSLVGQIVKSTHLDVKTVLVDGELKNTNDKIKTDPFSFFLINLKNHRMVLVRNQKGSPTLANFSSTARYFLKTYVKNFNNELAKNEEKLPTPQLNVVAIPFKGTIEEELKKVKKINKVTLRFYPLNGDEDTKETFSHLRNLLELTGSRSGNTNINTPSDHEGVAELITDTSGLVAPTVKVEYKDNTSRTLKPHELTEKTKIKLDSDEDFNKNIEDISVNLVSKAEYKVLSEENERLYNKWLSRLEVLYQKLFK